MAIRVENNNIYLSVRDLLPVPTAPQLLSSFPMPQRGALGRQAQTWLQKSRKNTKGLFHTEYVINQTYPFSGYDFFVSGRIDGVFLLPQRAEIEEIKSVILKKSEFSKIQHEQYPHFSEQLMLYAYMLQDALSGIELKTFLVLVNLVDHRDRTFPIPYNRIRTESLLMQRFRQIVEQIESGKKENDRKQKLLHQVNFQLSEKRPQQDKMMTSVQEALQAGNHLLVSAPTGTGKTAASLFPAIQYAYAGNKKIMFLTSKTSQQDIARQTLKNLVDQGLDLKVTIIRASQKMCANDVFFCHEEHCPFARNFRDRLNDSMLTADLLEHKLVTPDLIFEKAVQAELCPFEVNIDVSLNCDVVIGDYNYVFDPAVQLRRLFLKTDVSDWILVIDEAHNLYERGRNYLSPQLNRNQIDNLIDLIKKKKGKEYKNLLKGLKETDRLFDDLQLEGETHFAGQQYYEAQLNQHAWEDSFTFFESAYINYLIFKVRKGLLIVDDPFEGFYFAFRRFLHVSRFKERAFVTVYNAANGGELNIHCCDPSMYLGQKIEGFHSVIAMSATLDPMPYYQDVLGFAAERTTQLKLDSPFPHENRKVIIVPNISTRYKDRMTSYTKIAGVIKKTMALKPGNYLAFFPSYEYMQNVNLFVGNGPFEKVLQKPGMKEEERDLILQDFKEAAAPHLLMAVMGGLFSEGVDYSGDMAIGVFVVSPALPKFSYERQLLHRYYEQKSESGTEYAYVYPGMNKVIQATGRLIRGFTDKGVALLIGERFAENDFNELLPEYWFSHKGDIEITRNYEEAVARFWTSVG